MADQNNIQFRFTKGTQHLLRELLSRAKKAGKEPNDYARELVFRALEFDHGEELQSIDQRLNGIDDRMETFEQEVGHILLGLRGMLVETMRARNQTADQIEQHLNHMFGPKR